MTVDELLDYGKSKVKHIHAQMLLAILLDCSTLELLTKLDEIVPDEIADSYKEKVNRLRNNEPLQYVVGTVNFYGYQFKVNNNVLIPRFETEELVENVVNFINYDLTSAKTVLDLCTGSGAIGITLKKKINDLDVTLSDISKEALEVAKENAILNDVSVKIVESDMFNNIEGKFDVIVTNPPYIRDAEEIEDIVRDNEPNIALYGGIDGLDYYRIIRNNFLDYVNDKFLLAMEIGDLQREAITKIFSDINDVKIISKKDLNNRDRMIFIIR